LPYGFSIPGTRTVEEVIEDLAGRQEEQDEDFPQEMILVAVKFIVFLSGRCTRRMRASVSSPREQGFWSNLLPICKEGERNRIGNLLRKWFLRR
jgi:hypothetical protein